ncbi:MAG: rhodanese-like domain-containing protein [Verrucomicrobiales bacterium]|jgi:rhodanese-related sulfurtransferase|nr:rhodanese-like domain-containing protein [Verrucomicrobiales bacterium]
MNILSISPAELAQKIAADSEILLIDVRTPKEFAEVHAGQATSIPLDEISRATLLAQFPDAANREIYLICHSGNRSRKALQKLQAEGLTNLVNVEGGTSAWVQAGLPVISGKKSISLERQVRITAGSLVVSGALLAWLLHPLWILLSAFVGTGLVFAGLTDTCGMGLLLARMPWNRK